MGSVDRAVLPENFYDETSAMLLAQPEPQYLYCDLWKAAQRADLEIPDDLGLPGRTVSGTGQQYSSADRDRLMLSNPLAQQLVATPLNNMTGSPGHTQKFNRPKFADSTYTTAARQVNTGQTISTVGVTLSSDQVPLTLQRFAGPYDNANSRVAPYTVEVFDAGLGVHKASSIVGTHLKRDYDKFIDAVQVALLDTAATTVYAGGDADDDALGAAGASPMDLALIGAAEVAADEANLPTFADGFRVMVITPTQANQLKDDANFARLSDFHKEMNFLFPGYVRSVHRTHIFKSTTLTRVANASSALVQYGHYMAPGVLLGGMGRAPRVAPSTDDNYGETVKVIWIGDLAFGCADNRFVISVRSN